MLILHHCELAVVPHACHPRSWEVKAARPWILTNLSSIRRPCLKKEKEREKEKNHCQKLLGEKKITDSLVYFLDRVEKSAFVCPFNTICQDPVSINTCRVKAKLHTPLLLWSYAPVTRPLSSTALVWVWTSATTLPSHSISLLPWSPTSIFHTAAWGTLLKYKSRSQFFSTLNHPKDSHHA